MSNLLTASRLRSYRDCPRKHELEYGLGWRLVQQPDALSFGSLFHEGLEAWWMPADHTEQVEPVITARLNAALLAIRGRGRDELEQVKAEELLRGYDARWHRIASSYEVVGVEESFEAALINPESGRPSRTWLLAGKVDGLLRDADGRLLLLEHKTTSERIDDRASDYWLKLAMDAQITQYYIGAESLGHGPVDGCIYDVIRKPTIRPLLATPIEKQKRKADGSLYAKQRERDESPDEYRARLRSDIEARPEYYFQRELVARVEDDLTEYLADVWALGRAIREAERQGQHSPRNPNACHRYGRCAFWDVCAYGLRPEDHPEKYQQLADVHPELGGEDE